MMSSFLSDLKLQDISSSFSKTSKMCSHTLFSPSILVNRTSVLPKELVPLKEALGWACGKKNNAHNGIQKRHIPSAGARYPTEVLAIYFMDDVYSLYYYDVDNHEMYSTFNSDQAALGEIYASHNATERDVVIVFASVLWRTLERYGVRGYRYCLIETGCMASLLNEIRGSQSDRLILRTPTENLDRGLGLSCSTPATATCRLSLDSLSEVKNFRRAEKQGVSYIDEHTPIMNPLLKRVEKFHRKAMKAAKNIAVPESMFFFDYEKRRSANHFSETLLSGEKISLLKSELVGFCGNAASKPNDSLIIIVLSVEEEKFLSPVALWAYKEKLREFSIPSRIDIASFTEHAFQNQDIVKRASVIVVVGMSGYQDERFDHGYFATMTIKAGMLIADLYRLADKTDTATTTIGGFSDAQFVEILGLQNFHPLIAQVYGKEAEHCIKKDSRVLLTSERI